MKIKKRLLLFLYCYVSVKSVTANDTSNISFQSGNYKISGKIIAPGNQTKKVPAIIFLAGSGGNSSYLTNYKDFLHYFLEEPLINKEVAIMYFDKRGVGQSEGVWYQTNFEQRALDAKNAAEYLKTLSYINPEQIYVIGHSQGGWIVQLCLAEYPEVFAGGISTAGATFSVRKQLINDYQSSYICTKKLDSNIAYRKAKRTVNRVLLFTSLFPFKENWKQLKRIKKFDPAPYLVKIKKPLLLMWAENDRLVSPQWCLEELHTIFPDGIPANIQTHIVKGVNHSFKIAPFCYSGTSKDLIYSEECRKELMLWFLNKAGVN